ncbi:hypothetical protein STEG23_022333 [Scotinomys teguina]
MAAAAGPYITQTSRGSSSLHHADITHCCTQASRSSGAQQRRTAAPYTVSTLSWLNPETVYTGEHSAKISFL